MAYIVSYQKYIDEITTITLKAPMQDFDSKNQITELCTIDGTTYVSIPDDIVLPEQPEQIVNTIKIATLTDDLRDKIKENSSHVDLISKRMIDMIRQKYSIDDEMYFARIGVGAANGMYTPSSNEYYKMLAFGQFVESAREWGRTQRTLLGL